MEDYFLILLFILWWLKIEENISKLMLDNFINWLTLFNVFLVPNQRLYFLWEILEMRGNFRNFLYVLIEWFTDSTFVFNYWQIL